MSFYRTYRPQLLSDIDNIHVREQVTTLLKKNRSELPHAYLLTGPKGTGKTTTARILAKLYTCTSNSKKIGPCGECDACRTIASGTNMDVLELDAASNRGIDEIRELRDRIALAPTSGEYKIYIIDEVHMLTTEAFNALLKTLEEPPKHAVFILATTDVQKVPATIQSRCITIVFRKALPEELVQALERIVEKEHIEIEKDALSFIASIADGAFRDAVKLLEQVSFSTKKITLDSITDLLATSDSKIRERLFIALRTRNEQEVLTIINGLVTNGKDIKQLYTDLLHDLEDMLICWVGGKEGLLDKESCQTLSTLIISAYGQMKYSPIPELPLELALLTFCQKKMVSQDEQKNIKEKSEEEKAKGATVDKPGCTDTKEKDDDGEDKTDTDLVSVEKLLECWKEVIEAVKPYNHSIAGVLRSTHPKTISKHVLTIETQYAFHKERLSEPKVRDILSQVFKKLFGAKLSVDVVQSSK